MEVSYHVEIPQQRIYMADRNICNGNNFNHGNCQRVWYVGCFLIDHFKTVKGFRHHITIDEIREHLWLKRKKDTAGMKHQEEYLIELNKQRGESDNISVITIGTY